MLTAILIYIILKYKHLLLQKLSMKKTILLLLVSMTIATGTEAQNIGPSTLNATGGGGVIGPNEFEWSVGEMSLVSTFSGASIIVTQGVLQPFEAPVSVSIDLSRAVNLTVFPNPATANISIRYISTDPGTLTYKLIDMTGKTMINSTINTKEGTTTEQINLSELACATYMLEVTMYGTNGGANSTSYKIEKIK